MDTIHKTIWFSLLGMALLAGCNSKTSKLPISPASQLNTFPPSFAPEGPVARAQTNYRWVSVGEEVSLDAGPSHAGSASMPLRYRWTIIQSPLASQARLSTTRQQQTRLFIDKPGSYRLQLEVSDSRSRKDILDFTLSTDRQQLPRSAFIALGDYGKGSEQQRRVAQAIEKTCRIRSCEFVLGLGDNIYPAGVSAIDDKQFREKFEQPYANVALPFYMVLGNHDTSGLSAGDGGFNPRGDIQLAYARSDKKPSFRWQMPARYYRIPAPVEDVSRSNLIDIYALDTTTLMSPYDDIGRYSLPQIYQRQQDWLRNAKQRSKAQWQIAFAHHPYLSNGRHGNAGRYDYLYLLGDGYIQDRVNGSFVKRFTEENLCHDMDLILAGHEHSLQYLKPVEGCGNTEFIVSGAGAGYEGNIASNRNAFYWQTAHAPGFFHVEIIAQTMTISAYTVDADGLPVEQYRRTTSK